MQTCKVALLLAFVLWSSSLRGYAQPHVADNDPGDAGLSADVEVYSPDASSLPDSLGSESTSAILIAANASNPTEPPKSEDQAPVSDEVGSVKTVKGSVSIVSGGQTISAAVGTRLHVADVLKTEKDGSVGVILKDDTVISLGPSSELEMKDFKFEPKEEEYSFVTRMVRGTFVYVSGLIGKLSPESVKMETPVGIIAVRGTKLLIRIKG
ncbi:MAG: FecR family protein [Candidatus Hydrogenedentes bacterium]|nr:FecR family protein [Candidatus Hydrogenedentota bacterium]